MNSGKDIRRVCNPSLTTVRAGWNGNVVIGGRFYNDSTPTRVSVWQAIKWKLKRNPQHDEKRRDTFLVHSVPLDVSGDKCDRIVWLGHSSFLISVGGVQLLTDPCFGNLPGCVRRVKLPCPVGSLTDIDYILLSHDHRDHLDRRSLAHIAEASPSAVILAPLGARRVLSSHEVVEAGWWQEYPVAPGLRIVFLPARHWGRRGLCDYNKVLWGSFMIISGGRKIFFSGDTAYRQDMFRDIHTLFGDVDFCLMPIGAYSPAWMMSARHMNPEEAFSAFCDLGGKTFIPMHYGTYDLSDEPPGEPLVRLRSAAAAAGRAGSIIELPVGKGVRC